MVAEFKFTVDNNFEILICIPSLPHKINYFYETSEKLHKFDEADVFFIKEGMKLLLAQDTLDEIIYSFAGALKLVISNKSPLPSNLNIDKVGFELNKMLMRLSNYNLKQFWFWSSKKI